MAPPGIKDKLPLLNQLIKWFLDPGVVADSPVFKLHHQATSFIIILGFLFVAVENYLDTKAIICLNEFKPYPKLYCWIHGYSYIAPNLRDTATGCYVDQDKLSKGNGPITSYYLWLPYLLSFLFLLSKLPHSIWKKYFENQLIRHILAGREENWDQNWIKIGAGGGGGGGQNQQQGGGQKQQQQNGGGGGKKQNNQPQGWKLGKAEEIANQFIHYRDKYYSYQLSFAFWETFNLVTVLASIQATHWLLNNKFWFYGLEVFFYLNNYQSFQQHGEKLHDPMCEVFPTEVGCAFNYGGEAGQASRTEILCILGNNLFNQKYFFVLWVWWMFLLVISIFGIVFRLLRIFFRAFSKAMLMRKSHGRHFTGIRISSSEAFVLELVLDNLGKTPTFASKVMTDVAARLKELSLNEYDDTLDCVKTPLMKSIDTRYQDTPSAKQDLGTKGVPQPIHEKKSFYLNNLNQSGGANLIKPSENFQQDSKVMTDETLEPIYSCLEAKPKLSAKERKRLKKEEAKKLAKTLEPLPQVKEETKDQSEEVLVKIEEPSVERFPQLPRPSDNSVAGFPESSKSEREWL